eukprot:10305910-Karenia_brevis.AAC.1
MQALSSMGGAIFENASSESPSMLNFWAGDAPNALSIMGGATNDRTILTASSEDHTVLNFGAGAENEALSIMGGA